MTNTFSLAEIADVVDCEHKTAPTVEQSEYLSIRTTDILNGRIAYEQANRVSHDTYTQWTRRAVPQPGDLILAREAPVGEVGYIKNNYTVCLGQRTVLVHPTSDAVDKKYLLYYLVNPVTKHELRARSTGSVVAHLNMKDIRAFEVSLPPLPEQKAIAAVLSSLDDKIDLLQRQNATLEALAQTLFRQWFVEEAGDNWEEKPLDEIADYLNGLACQKYPPENEGEMLPVLKIKDLRGGITEQSDWATSKVEEKYLVENGDVIFSWSGSLMVKIWDGERCVLNQHLFKVTSGEYPKWFYYLWTVHHLNKFIAIAQSKATTMGHIKRRDISSSMVLVPSDNEMEEMTHKVEPIFEKMILNNRQIRTLEKLRDTLLPKLMSGEVRVTC